MIFLTLLLLAILCIAQGKVFDQKVYCKIDEYQISYKECRKCDYQCLSCIGPTAKDCLKCRHNKFKNECLFECPENYFSQNGQCKTCSTLYCKQCLDMQQCQTCEDGFKISDNRRQCIYQSQNFFVYKEGDTLKETVICKDQYATNYEGKYCQAIPFCLKENFINELKEICFSISNKNTNGIKMALMKESVVYYNEKQANIYRIKDYQYEDSIQISEKLVKIVYYERQLYILYTTSVEIYAGRPLFLKNKIKQPKQIFNTKKSYIFSLGRFSSILLTITSQNDECKTLYFEKKNQFIKFNKIDIIQDLQTKEIIAKSYVGQLILDIRVELTNHILMLVTLQTIKFFQLEVDDFFGINLIFKQSFPTNRNSTNIIENVYSQFYLSKSQDMYALLFDEYRCSIFNIKQFKLVVILNVDPYNLASVIQELGKVSFHYNGIIALYDLNLMIYQNKIELNEISVFGNNFLIICMDQFVYIASKDFIQSYVSVYDLSLTFLQKIPLKQGKITSMHIRKSTRRQDQNALIVSQEDNIAEIQGFQLKRYLIENCFNQPVKFFGQTTTQINGYVMDQIRRIHFYVSINIYGNLVFILIKDNKVIKYIEIIHPELINLELNLQLQLYINQVDRQIKIFGLSIKGVKYVIIFSYFQFNIINIQKYSDILFLSSSLAIVQNLNDFDNIFYIRNTFQQNPKVILSNTNSIGKCLQNDNYIVIQNLQVTQNSEQYNFISMDSKSFSFCQSMNIIEEYQSIDFISEDKILLITKSDFHTFNLSDCSLIKSLKHQFQNNLRDIQVRADKNLLIFDEFIEITDKQTLYDHNYHFLNLQTYSIINSFKPMKVVNGQIEDFNQLNAQIFILDTNNKSQDFNSLIILTSYDNIDSNNNQQTDFCDMYITEFIVNDQSIKQTRIYKIVQECVSLNKWAEQYYKQYKTVQLFQQKIFGQIQEQFQFGCSFNCQEDQEVQIYQDQVIYQEKIIPNFAKILSGDTLFYTDSQKIKMYSIYPKFNIIMIEYSTQSDSDTETNIQLIKYPQNEIIFNKKINQKCFQIIANIVEIQNALFICDSNVLSIYDLNNISKFNDFDIQKVCKEYVKVIKLNQFKGNFVAECKLKFSFYDPVIFINGEGIYNYFNNTFTSHPELIFDIQKIERSNDSFQGNIYQDKIFIEKENEILVILYQTMFFYDKTDNYQKRLTTLKLNSQNYFFEQNYFITLNEHQSYEILQIYDYKFASIISFQEYENVEFNNQYYIDCRGFNKMLVTYTMKIVGFDLPLTQSNNPFFTYNIGSEDKNFSVQLCTDEHLILLVNITSNFNPTYEIQVISYETQSLVKTFTIRSDQLIYNQNLIKVGSQNWYNKQKGIALIQNVIISLIEDDSDLLYILPTLDFAYDDINDYGIIVEKTNNDYIQVIDFSLIFPFNLNSYSFANDIMIGPYVYGYTNKTTNLYQNKWIIFYNSYQNAIYFYDFDDETETKLKLDDNVIKYSHQILYNIEIRPQLKEIDPEEDPNFPNEELIKKLNFACLFNNYAVIFSKEKIIQYLPIQDYDKNIPEGSLRFDDQSQSATFTRITMNNITHEYEIIQRHVNLPTNIGLGKILHTVFYSQDLLLYLAFIDSNGYFVVDENVFIKLPEDYQVDKINLFDIIVNDKTAQSIFILGTPQKISIYNESLDKLLEMDTLSGSIQHAVLEENCQYLFLITSNTLMVYRYKLNEEKVKITQIETVNKFNLLSRNLNRLSKINENHIAVISKSMIQMFLLTQELVQFIYSIRNSNFNIIQNALLFDGSKFLIIWDVHRVYLYDVETDDGEIVQIFYREYTHMKILYTGYYWSDNRSFIRLIGVTATNVFDIRNEVKNLDKNAEQQILYQTFRDQRQSINSISSQCIQVDNLYQNIYEQSQQIDYLVQKSHTMIYSIVFNVQYDNQAILIPEKSYLENLTDGLKLIYNLNYKNIRIVQNNQDPLHTSFYKHIEFKNGTIDLYQGNSDQQTGQSERIVFANFQALNLQNVFIKRSLEIQSCEKVYLKRLAIDSSVDSFKITGLENSFNCIYAIDFVIYANEMNKNFLQIEKYFQVNINNFFIYKSENQRVQILQNENKTKIIDWKIKSFTGFVNIQNVRLFNLTGFYVQDVPSDITLFSIIQIENVTIHDVKASNLNWDAAAISKERSNDYRIAFFDIFLVLTQIEISKINIKNCMFDRVIKINSTIYETFDFIQQVQFSKNLTVFIKDLVVQNLKPKGTIQPNIAYYNIIQLQASNAYLTNFIVDNVNGFTSCFYLQKINKASVKNLNISDIQDSQNIISFSQIDELDFQKIQITNFTNIFNCFFLQDSKINLSEISITNPSKSNLYVLDSAIKITFNQLNSSILIRDTIIQNIQNQRGNGTAIHIINVNEVKLQNVKLISNFCILNGGAIYAINSNIFVYQLQVTDNTSVLSGGGIYLLMSQIELDQEFKDHDTKKSFIQNNYASVGGGIRYISTLIPNIIQSNNSLISNNFARFYGKDYAMYPKSIQIISDENYEKVSSSLLVIKQKVKFYWIDEQDNYLKYYDEKDSLLKLFNVKIIDDQFTDLIQELKQYKLVNIFSEEIIFDSISNQIELNGVIQKDEKQGYEYIEIESSFLLSPKQKSQFYIYAPIKYIPMTLKSIITNLSKPVNVEFRECVEGEIIQEYLNSQNKQYFQCCLCQNNTYSLQKPLNKDQKCQICPDYSLSCEGNQIIAMQGYWRQLETDIIEECFNQPLKCTRQNPKQNSNQCIQIKIIINNSLMQCSEGGFGPRCESCDYLNVIYKDYFYGKSGKFNCNKFEKNDGFAKEIVITILLVLIFSVYQGYSVIKINKQMTNQLIMFFLKKAGLINFQVTLSKSGFSSLVKFFVGYFQMLQILLQFRFKIPEAFLSTVVFIGNPLETSIYSLDFAFIKLGYHKYIEIVYLRLIWLYINSLAYFLLAVILSSIYIFFRKRKYKASSIFKIILLQIVFFLIFLLLLNQKYEKSEQYPYSSNKNSSYKKLIQKPHIFKQINEMKCVIQLSLLI